MKTMLFSRAARTAQWQGSLTKVAALVLFGFGSMTSAVSQTPTPVITDAVDAQGVVRAAVGTRKTEVTLRELGALYPLKLLGIRSAASVPFSVRSDEVVTSARLRLNYAYSPALLPRLSHIKVLVNEQLADTIPVSQEDGGKNLQRDIQIPARLITEFNRIQLELIGHYTLDCEDPAHTSLWANIGNDSTLEMNTVSVIRDNDLARLPQPFFDRRDVRPLVLPMVFAETPNEATLEAAATLSSWFGSLASYRGARFPVSVNGLPERGNGLLLVMGSAAAPTGLSLPAFTGSSVSVVANPNDPRGKLLVLRGRDGAELKKAAAALAIGAPTLTGASADIVEFTPLKPRQPYDAPNWLPSHRPVQFGELAGKKSLNVSGYTPDLIRIDMNLPPALFSWRDDGVPINLKYRYNAPAAQNRSSLNVNVNEQFLRALPLRPMADRDANVLSRTAANVLPAGELVLAEEKFYVPLFKLPTQAQLQFHYFHDMVKQGPCKDVVLDNARGTVEPDSTIDISGFPHFLAMPDLAAFGNSGFPFTRMADLSETAVVLPNKPDISDYSVLLNLAGVMGRITGYPAAALTVVGADQVDTLQNKDLLVFGSGQRQPLHQRWADYLPVRFDDQGKSFALSDVVYRAFSWWGETLANDARVRGTEVAFRSSGKGAVIVGFESPLQRGRSVVMLSSDQPGGLNQVIDALLDPERLAGIQGSVAMVRGDQVTSLLAEKSYHVGKLPPLLYAQWFLSRHPLVLMALGIASAALLGLVMYLALRSRARARLGKSQN
jgi:hypothetical protein